MLELLGVYISGMVSGVCLLFILGTWATRKEKRKEDDVKKKYKTVQPRLKKAAEISNQQLELLAQTQAPSMNSLHSRFKNDLVHQIKELEKEKRSILRSIIKEGFDPTLTISTPEGGKESLKLSEYMVRNGIEIDDPTDSPVPEGGKPTKNSKFFVIDGGKSDQTH